MFKMLIELIFGLISKLAMLIMSPIILLVNTIIPEVGQFIGGVFTFIGYGMDYIAFFLKLLCIPQFCVIAVVSLASVVLVFNATVYVYYFALAVYNYFKP